MTITSKPHIMNMLETGNLCQNVQFWILYRIPPITQFRPKVDLGPFGNERFIWNFIFSFVNCELKLLDLLHDIVVYQIIDC